MTMKAMTAACAAALLISAAVFTAESPAAIGSEKPTNEKILYVKKVQEGETIWDVCSKVAGPKDDLNQLVLETIKNNHLDGHPERLQAGQELRIRVKAANRN